MYGIRTATVSMKNACHDPLTGSIGGKGDTVIMACSHRQKRADAAFIIMLSTVKKLALHIVDIVDQSSA